MNERLKELALKAYNNAGQGTPEALSSFMEVYSEKFAELIVRECLGIINKEHDEGIDRHGDYQLALYEAYREIKQHFGVE